MTDVLECLPGARSYHGLRRIAAFLEDLRAGRAAPEEIEPMLREILSDPGLELRFWLPDSEIYVDARGHPPSDSPGDQRLRTPVIRAGVRRPGASPWPTRARCRRERRSQAARRRRGADR